MFLLFGIFFYPEIFSLCVCSALKQIARQCVILSLIYFGLVKSDKNKDTFLTSCLFIQPMITFTARGHKNVLSTHRNTIEFTHDKHLTLRGDCILAINANYSLEKIHHAHLHGKIKIVMTLDGISDEIIAEYNPLFQDAQEMVIRKTDFVDRRTFAIKADKVANDIDRRIVEKMKKPDAVLEICITPFIT